METIKQVIAVIFGTLLAIGLSGFLFGKLWLWFIVPTFNLEPLRFIEAVGICLVVEFLTMKYELNKPVDDFWEDLIKRIFYVIMVSIIIFSTGWILSLFM